MKNDVTLWMTDCLHKVLTKVILAKQDWPFVYYIMVITKDGYLGPLDKRNNELLNQGETGEKTIDLSKKHVIHNRLIIMREPPPIPMIGTSLWRISNKLGEARCIYILPPDKPMITGTQMGEASKFIWKSAKNAPLIYSVN